MRNPVSLQFRAIFRAEVLLNLKRVAPYLLIVLFSANAILWWGWGPAVERGWAVNSDFYIVRLFCGFSFMTLPLFIALLMGDPVIRDFRVGVDPLIFSKPVGRAEYLLGKFFANFFVLVCCQASFAVTLLLLQAFNPSGMIVLSPRLLPYVLHFFFFVAVSSLAMGAVYFTIGTLTRNVKIVYALGVSFYFFYIAWQLMIKSLPVGLRVTLDPLLFNVGVELYKGYTVDALNHLAISYDRYMIANRLLMLAVSLLCLSILYFRFSTTDAAKITAERYQLPLLNLTPQSDRLYNDTVSSVVEQSSQAVETVAKKKTAIPSVNLVTQGFRANLEQFIAALKIEFHLLCVERSLIVTVPLILFLCGLELGVYQIVHTTSYSAAYAGRTAETLLLFLFGISVFYSGESMHRDREAKIEEVLWSVPTPNFVLLLSKFAITFLLSLSIIALVGLTAIGIQIYKGHTPLETQKYLLTYAVILVPNAVFMIASCVALNVFLRDKYLTYAICFAIGGGLYYMVGQGYNNPLYNPVLYGLWTPSDFENGGVYLSTILIHRLYCFALSILLLSLALFFFERKTMKGLKAHGRLNGRGRTVLTAVIATLAAVICGLIIHAL